MKTILTILILFGLTVSCAFGQTNKNESKQYSDVTDLHPSDTLIRVYNGDLYELGVPSGYVNQKGDTVIPIGKYQYCFLDTVTTHAIVGDKSGFYAIGQKGNRLFDVYWFENGPDYLKDGLFRIKRNGKIGYANTKGEIVIEPQFDCANPFENGKAKVTFDCELQKVGEHTVMKSDNWFYIDKKGEKIE
jgi:hypothetical protein